jgi:hypothetical protein
MLALTDDQLATVRRLAEPLHPHAAGHTSGAWLSSSATRSPATDSSIVLPSRRSGNSGEARRSRSGSLTSGNMGGASDDLRCL